MATADVITETNQEGSSNTYTIRPNFQHKYVATSQHKNVLRRRTTQYAHVHFATDSVKF